MRSISISVPRDCVPSRYEPRFISATVDLLPHFIEHTRGQYLFFTYVDAQLTHTSIRVTVKVLLLVHDTFVLAPLQKSSYSVNERAATRTAVTFKPANPPFEPYEAISAAVRQQCEFV